MLKADIVGVQVHCRNTNTGVCINSFQAEVSDRILISHFSP